MNDIKRYVVINGSDGVFENKCYLYEKDAKERAYDAVKNGEIQKSFAFVNVQEITF